MSRKLSEEDKYWKILWNNIKLSAKHGAGGARISKMRGNEEKDERDLEITLEDIKELWEKQKGLCYWLNIQMSLPDLEIKDSPFAPSAERLNNDLGYVPGNVVLASRFANRGRGAYNGKDFENRLNKLLLERSMRVNEHDEFCQSYYPELLPVESCRWCLTINQIRNQIANNVKQYFAGSPQFLPVHTNYIDKIIRGEIKND